MKKFVIKFVARLKRGLAIIGFGLVVNAITSLIQDKASFSAIFLLICGIMLATTIGGENDD